MPCPILLCFGGPTPKCVLKITMMPYRVGLRASYLLNWFQRLRVYIINPSSLCIVAACGCIVRFAHAFEERCTTVSQKLPRRHTQVPYTHSNQNYASSFISFALAEFASSLRTDTMSDSPPLLRNDAQTSFAICYPVRRTSPVSKILSGFFSTSTGWIANPSCVLAVVARVRLVRFTSALEGRRARECDKLPRSHMHVGCLKTNSGIYSFKRRGNKYSHARLCFAIVAASFPCLSVSCVLPTTQKTPFGPRPVHNRSIVQKRAWFVNLKYLSTN